MSRAVLATWIMEMDLLNFKQTVGLTQQSTNLIREVEEMIRYVKKTGLSKKRAQERGKARPAERTPGARAGMTLDIPTTPDEWGNLTAPVIKGTLA